MSSRLNDASGNIAPYQAPVAKPLSELPKQERRKVTSELMRIHNLVNALEANDFRDSDKDKSDNKPSL